MSTQTKFKDEATESLLKGIRELSDAVTTTLGPKGRNVALGQPNGMPPKVVHDGVTVAKAINPADPFENMGAQLLKEAASKTNDASGDGTTTATLLADRIITGGVRRVQAGSNPMILKKGIDLAIGKVVAELKKSAKEIKNEDDIRHIATVSSASEEIGDLITEAIKKVGGDGVISVEDGQTIDITMEHKEGMAFDKGWASPYLITDTSKMVAVIENPYILITDKRLSSFDEILPFVESLIQHTKNLLIIAEGFDGQGLAGVIINKLQGNLQVLAVQAPLFGDRRTESLEDMAILTGATLISETTGKTLAEATVADCGKAEKVTSSKDTTTIIGGKGTKTHIEARKKQLKSQIEDAESEFDREFLKTRLAKLAGGVAIISVGAASEVERSDRRERVVDAVEATKSARDEGIIVGGGVALLKARKCLLAELSVNSGEIAEGIEIVYNALAEPLKKIVENCGEDSGWVLKEVEKSKEPNFGYDANTGEFCDLMKRGIIDPVKVTKNALQNAASIASMVLTTDVLVNEIPEEKGGKDGK